MTGVHGALAHVRREARASIQRLQRIALQRIRDIERQITKLSDERARLVESFDCVVDAIRQATDLSGTRRLAPPVTSRRWKTVVVGRARGSGVAGAGARRPAVLGSHLTLVGGRRVPPETLTLREIERDHIAAVLTSCDWNQSQAAIRLGIGRNTLMRKVKTFGLKKVPAKAA